MAWSFAGRNRNTDRMPSGDALARLPGDARQSGAGGRSPRLPSRHRGISLWSRRQGRHVHRSQGAKIAGGTGARRCVHENIAFLQLFDRDMHHPVVAGRSGYRHCTAGYPGARIDRAHMGRQQASAALSLVHGGTPQAASPSIVDTSQRSIRFTTTPPIYVLLQGQRHAPAPLTFANRLSDIHKIIRMAALRPAYLKFFTGRYRCGRAPRLLNARPIPADVARAVTKSSASRPGALWPCRYAADRTGL